MINLRGELKLNILGSNLKLTPISYDAVFLQCWVHLDA